MNALSLTTSGAIRVDGSGTTQPISGTVNVASQPDVVASGTITAADSTVAAPSGNGALLSGASTTGSYVFAASTGGCSSWAADLIGSFGGGNVCFEVSLDSTNGINGNWIAVNGRQTGVINTNLNFNTSVAGTFRGNIGSGEYFRIRMTGATSPSLAVIIRLSTGTGAVFLNASIPSGTNTIGSVNTNYQATTGSTAPTIAALVGGKDASGNIQVPQVDKIYGQTVEQLSTATTITSPGAATHGAYAYVNAYGTLRVSSESTNLFNDNFNQGIDSNKWISTNVSGGGSIAFSNGIGSVSSGTAANAYAVLKSIPTFTNYGSTFLIYATVMSVIGSLTGSYMFFGLGNPATTPTMPAPLATTSTALIDAIGFELDSVGNFYAVIYASGNNVYLSSALTAPTSSQSRYGFQSRGDVVIFYVGTTEYPAAVPNFIGPNNDTLPVISLSVNGSSSLSSAPTVQLQALGVGDSGKNSAQISDGVYPWQKATVKAGSVAPVSTDSALVVTLSPNGSLSVQDPFIGSLTGSVSGGLGGRSFGQVATAVALSTVVMTPSWSDFISAGSCYVKSSSANDNSAAISGAKAVKITFYDGSMNGPYTETVSLNGTTPVAMVATNVRFVEKGEIVTFGPAAPQTTAGIISLSSTSGGSYTSLIGSSSSRSYLASHHVRAGKTCYITSFSGSTTVTAGTFLMFARYPLSSTINASTQLAESFRVTTAVQKDTRFIVPIVVTGPAFITVYIVPDATTASTYYCGFDWVEF
jgi:hypothetical protein